jgi:hypothetical protein
MSPREDAAGVELNIQIRSDIEDFKVQVLSSYSELHRDKTYTQASLST